MYLGTNVRAVKGESGVFRRVEPRISARKGRKGATHLQISRRRRHILPCQASQEATEQSTTPSSEEDSEDFDEVCRPFVDREGNLVQVLCCDYGFRSKDRMYGDEFGKIPEPLWSLAIQNFKHEYQELRRAFRQDVFKKISDQNPAKTVLGKAYYWVASGFVQALAALDKKLEENKIVPEIEPRETVPLSYQESIDGEEVTELVAMPKEQCEEIGERLSSLKLSNDAVWDRERARIARGEEVKSPWFVKIAYYSLCFLLDVLFNNRPLQRFWFLETVARMPYFSYISMLHLYESLGWWRQGSVLRKIHFAEEWNELHHLQIMESLGGDQYWIDRFLGQHSAILYYWILLLFYVVSPELAYNFSELIEAHAVDTYGEFVDANEDLLKELPPPFVAVQYYRGDDLYMFDNFQTSKKDGTIRRPTCANLYDVFVNIRDDEGEHVKTMKACQDETIVRDLKEQIKSSKY